MSFKSTNTKQQQLNSPSIKECSKISKMYSFIQTLRILTHELENWLIQALIGQILSHSFKSWNCLVQKVSL